MRVRPEGGLDLDVVHAPGQLDLGHRGGDVGGDARVEQEIGLAHAHAEAGWG